MARRRDLSLRRAPRALLHALPLMLLTACPGGDDSSATGGAPTQPSASTMVIAAGSPTLALRAGASGTVPLALARGGPFAGPVALSVEGAPAGVSASLSPATIAAGASEAALTVTTTTAAAPGSVALTVRARGTGVSDATTTITLEISAVPAAPVAISLAPGSASVAAGGTQQFTATVSGTSNTNVLWSSSATSAATVSGTGLVTGVAPGITTITACAAAEPTRCAQAAVTVTGAAPAATLLTSGTGVTNLSGAEGSTRLYRIVVPAGATQLEVRTSGGTGDIDLYVRRGQAPSSTGSDCASEGADNTERCAIANPAAGDWYILIGGFDAYSGLTLTATVTGGGTTPPTPPPTGAVAISFQQPTMTVVPESRMSQAVTIARNGYVGPIALEIEPTGDQFVTATLTKTTLADPDTGSLLTVLLHHEHSAQSFPLRVRAKIAGRPDVVASATIVVRSPLVYGTAFTGPQWEMFDIASNGARCEYFVSVKGTATVSYDRLNSTGIETMRGQITMTSTAKQAQVGNVSCNSGTVTMDLTATSLAAYPLIGMSALERKFSDWSIRFLPSGVFGESGANGGSPGRWNVRITGSSTSGLIGEQPPEQPISWLPKW